MRPARIRSARLQNTAPPTGGPYGPPGPSGRRARHPPRPLPKGSNVVGSVPVESPWWTRCACGYISRPNDPAAMDWSFELRRSRRASFSFRWLRQIFSFLASREAECEQRRSPESGLRQRYTTGTAAHSILPGIGLCLAISAVAWRGRPQRRGCSRIPMSRALVMAILLGIAVRTAWTPGPRFRTGIAFSAKQIPRNRGDAPRCIAQPLGDRRFGASG